MNYILKPSLQHMALVKVVAALWNKDDIKVLIAKFKSHLSYEIKTKAWKKIEKKVVQKVPHLPLPGLIKEKILGFIKPMGLKILKWVDFHCGDSYLHVHLPAEFSWTPQGTIDGAKTAKALIKDENLDVIMRYKLACFYCLEDDILKLFEKIPEHFGETFLLSRNTKENIQNNLVFYWTCKMKNCCLRTDFSCYKSYFECCAFIGNKAATKHFLQFLTPKEMEEADITILVDGDFLCFLLSEMEEEQQVIFFRSDPCTVLQCFLDWPMQCFFIDAASRVWDYLSKEDYFYLLQMINFQIVDGYKDWDYKQLFNEFWQKTPDALKNFDADELNKKHLLSLLRKIKDTELLQLILKDITRTVKKKLVYSVEMRSFFLLQIKGRRWNYLECFFRECLPSEDEKLKFKREFEESIVWRFDEYRLLTRNKNKWNRLFNLSEVSACAYGKRSVEKGERSRSSKRLRDLR